MFDILIRLMGLMSTMRLSDAISNVMVIRLKVVAFVSAQYQYVGTKRMRSCPAP